MAGNVDLASIVLFSADPVKTIAFYHRLGFIFENEAHGDGLVHAASDLGSVHFAAFQGACYTWHTQHQMWYDGVAA